MGDFVQCLGPADRLKCHLGFKLPGEGFAILFAHSLLLFGQATILNYCPETGVHYRAPSAPAGKELVWTIIGLPNGAVPIHGNLSNQVTDISINTTIIQEYILKIGIDVNINGELDISEPVVQELRILVVNNNYVVDQTILSGGTWLTGTDTWDWKLTSTFLDLFLGNKTGLKFNVPSPIVRTVDPDIASDGMRIDHFAGADYQIDKRCTAQITQYVFDKDSDVSKYVAQSGNLKSLIIKQIDEQLKDKIVTYYNSHTDNPDPFKLPNKMSDNLNFNSKDDYTFAIGESTITGIDISVYTERNANGICINKVMFQGTIDDLYDFNIFKIPPADIAARVEFGYSAGLGKEGQVYWNTIVIDQEVQIGQFCY